MKLTIVFFKTAYDTLCTRTVDKYSKKETIENSINSEGNFQISEFFEVDVPMLSEDEQLQKQVSAIDSIISKTEKNFTIELNNLKARKQELLALTHTKENQ